MSVSPRLTRELRLGLGGCLGVVIGKYLACKGEREGDLQRSPRIINERARD